MRPVIAVLVGIALVVTGCSDDDTVDLSGPAQVEIEPGVSVAVGDLDELAAPTSPATVSAPVTGGGTVTVNGVTYDVDAQICSIGPDATQVEGVAVGSDGSTAWVAVEGSVTTRAEAAATMDEPTIARLFGDRDVLDQTSVTVDVGRATLDGGSPPDQPSWSAVVGPAGRDDLAVDVTADGLHGVGTAEDLNAVALPTGDTAPIEFDVRCG